jgi:hypothetical protein
MNVEQLRAALSEIGDGAEVYLAGSGLPLGSVQTGRDADGILAVMLVPREEAAAAEPQVEPQGSANAEPEPAPEPAPEPGEPLGDLDPADVGF